MSLGFLTESALVPSKAKPIKVNSKSLVDLKAIVYVQEQEKKKREEARGLSSFRSKRGAQSKRKKQRKDEEKNKGIEKRQWKDEEEDVLNDDERSKKKRYKQVLIEKAKLYDELAKGGAIAGHEDLLVNFQAKTSYNFHTEHSNEEPSNMVEIMDEFGRTVSVDINSKEYERLKANASAKPSATDKKNGSFVTSQWEKRFNAEEKGFLAQVHEETAKARITLLDKNQRKQLRLAKLKKLYGKETQVPDEISREASEFLSTFSNQFMQDNVLSNSAGGNN